MDGELTAVGGSGSTDWRQWLVSAGHQASRDYDRLITTLASGALGLTLIFIHDVAPKPRHVAVVIAAWACFAASLLAILTSLLSSERAIRSDIDTMDRDSTDALPKPRSRWIAGLTTALNWASLGLLMAGVVCFVIFAGTNISGK